MIKYNTISIRFLQSISNRIWVNTIYAEYNMGDDLNGRRERRISLEATVPRTDKAQTTVERPPSVQRIIFKTGLFIFDYCNTQANFHTPCLELTLVESMLFFGFLHLPGTRTLIRIRVFLIFLKFFRNISLMQCLFPIPQSDRIQFVSTFQLLLNWIPL